jgi:tetratricopeptide (TPR) repeat protein
MRLSLAAGLVLLTSLSAAATGWRSQPLPPEVERLNRTADAAASSAAAIRLYAQSLRLHPANGPALLGLGLALLDADRPADAVKALRRLDALHPDDAEILVALATATARLPDARRPDIRTGLELAGRAVLLQPGLPAAWHALSILRHLDGDYAQAAEAARQAVELEAHNLSDPEATALYQQQEIACHDALLVFSPLD